jgi:hypothetical protein
MIMNEDIADRREAYFKPDYSQLPDYENFTPKKRDYKEMTIRDEDAQLTKNFNIFVGQIGIVALVRKSKSDQTGDLLELTNQRSISMKSIQTSILRKERK